MLDDALVLPNLIGVNAEKEPDAVGLQEADGRAVTWREYHDANRRYAAALRAVGIEAGEHVATMIPLCADGVHVWLGLSLIGAVEVPINPLMRGALLERQVEISQARVLVISPQNLTAHADDVATLSQIETVVVLGSGAGVPSLGKRVVSGDSLLADASEPGDLRTPKYWDVAAATFTSGTTGGSKAVVLPWGHVYASAEACAVLATPGRGMFLPTPLYHYAARYIVYLGALRRAKLVTRAQFSTKDFWDDVRRHDISGTFFLGPWANFLLLQPERDDDADNPLEVAIIAPMIERHAEFGARFGISTLLGGYGSTEVGGVWTTEDCPDKITSVGKPRKTIAGMEYRLVDENDLPVPRGEVGELVTRSATPWTMMLGYLGDPEATASAWRNGWFHSGDSFIEDEDGVLYFVDRAKDVLRRRGENISSVELETLVLAHADVAEAAAIGVPSPLGEDDVMILVVPRAGADLTPEALVDGLDEGLPKHMRPRYVEIVEELPKTVTQRVRKTELRERGVTAATWDRESPPSRPTD